MSSSMSIRLVGRDSSGVFAALALATGVSVASSASEAMDARFSSGVSRMDIVCAVVPLLIYPLRVPRDVARGFDPAACSLFECVKDTWLARDWVVIGAGVN